MSRSTFNWLHLTDLHFGNTGQKPLWPNVREAFFNDLAAIHERTGPWDAVLFTGDLVQRGSVSEFQDLDGEVLSPLWEKLKRLGSGKAVLLAVPGNHDLVRPAIGRKPTPTEKFLLNPELFKQVAEEFWGEDLSDYRQVVNEAFQGFVNWRKSCPMPRPRTISDGLLPGDFSTSLETADGHRVGVLGLNTTFLQLAPGEYMKKLTWGLQQFHKACNGDGPGWVNEHDVCLLLTHQGPQWLDKGGKAVYREINPAGRFAVHLFGHMHTNKIRSTSYGGGQPVRVWQGISLFSQEQWSDRPQSNRRHGYAAGRIVFGHDSARIRHWPRSAEIDRNGVRLGPDTKCVLQQDEGTTPEQIPLRQRSLEANDSPVEASSRSFSAQHRASQVREHVTLALTLPDESYDPVKDGTTVRRHQFQYCRTPLHGRSKEKEILTKFLKDEPNASVRWMVMSAPAGSGKSRIALWLCKMAAVEGWDCGFLEAKQITWQKWRPCKPTLIIIDDVEERYDAARFAITQIVSPKEGLTQPVRFLLLARSHCHDVFGAVTPDLWWSRFTRLENDLCHSTLTTRAYGGDLTNALHTISPLANRPTGHMVTEILEDRVKFGGVVRQLKWGEKAHLCKRLRQFDSLRRPLFVAFAAEAVAYNGFDAVRNWNQQELGEYVLKREIDRWQSSKVKVDPEHLNLLTLASFLGHEDLEVCTKCRQAGCNVPSRVVSAIVGLMCGYAKHRHIDRLAALEPDVLSQHWILQRIQGQAKLPTEESAEVRSQTIAITGFAWTCSPQKVGSVIRRCVLDSASHPAVGVLINKCIEGEPRERNQGCAEVLLQVGFALNSVRQHLLAEQVFRHILLATNSETETNYARLGLGVALFGLQHVERAEEQFEIVATRPGGFGWHSLLAEGLYWRSHIRQRRGEIGLASADLNRISRLPGASRAQKEQAHTKQQNIAEHRMREKATRLEEQRESNWVKKCDQDFRDAMREKAKKKKKRLLARLVKEGVPASIAAVAGLELGRILRSEGEFEGAANAFKKVESLRNAPSKTVEAAKRELLLLRRPGRSE